MPRFRPYVPAGARRFQAAMDEYLWGPKPVKPDRSRARPDWTWLEDKMLLGVSDFTKECAAKGKFEGCRGIPTKPRLVLEAAALDMLPLETRTNPDLFVNLCDGCFLLKLSGEGYRCKARWVQETALAIRMSPTNVRKHYEVWLSKLNMVLVEPRSRAAEVALGAPTITYEFRRWGECPEIPPGGRILYFNLRRLREEGVISIVVSVSTTTSVDGH